VQNLANGHTFFFAAYNSLIPLQYLFYSAYFNMTTPSASSSSTSSSSTSSPSTSSPSTSMSAASSSAVAKTVVVTSTATVSPTSSPASGGSHVDLGVGVGVGVGGALLLLAGAFWFFRRRQKSQIGELTETEYKLSYGGVYFKKGSHLKLLPTPFAVHRTRFVFTVSWIFGRYSVPPTCLSCWRASV
jgi:LPXTG-motif cell wall-anchored protein